MSSRVKRTYNLTPEAVAHVRAMVGRGDLPASQDGIVELAIDHLFREFDDQADAVRWAQAGRDEAFAAEVRSLAADFADVETRPPG